MRTVLFREEKKVKEKYGKVYVFVIEKTYAA